MNLVDQRILITGGTRGIGRALALTLAEAGARVLVCSSAREHVAAMRDVHPRVFATTADITEPEDRRALERAVDTRLGGLDVLVNNAGIQRSVDLLAEPDPDELEHEIQVNLVAPIRLTQRLLPKLLASENGAIVNVGSVLGMAPRQGAPIYATTKAGLSTWTTALRYQLESAGVLVMELVPPMTETGMTRGRDGERIAPDVVAEACLRGLEQDRERVAVGRARLAGVVQRLWPSLLRNKLRHA